MSTKETRREREINRRQKTATTNMPKLARVTGTTAVTDQQRADVFASTVQAETPILADVIRLTGFVPVEPDAAATQLLPIIEQAEAVA